MIKALKILKSHNKFRIKPGLERISAILELLYNPQKNFKIIHVAGTNGKGSTSKIINDILINCFKADPKKKLKVGLYTSPHLFSYTERIKVDNINISEFFFDKLIFEINNLAQRNNIDLTEFELLTACAFYYFYLRNVDFVVLEAGLGGLFDATNVIEKSISVITDISFDHIDILGSAIEEIARQKAGIIKENSFVVVSKENKGFFEISKAINKKCAKLAQTPSVQIEFDKKTFKNQAVVNFEGKIEKYDFNLWGSHQAKNLSLALGAIKCIKKIYPEVFQNLDENMQKHALKNALNEINWDFRLYYNREKNLLIDCAHNPSGIKTLKTFLDENFKNEKKTFIFGCLKTKDYKEMLSILTNDFSSSTPSSTPTSNSNSSSNSSLSRDFYFVEFNHPSSLKYSDLPLNLKNKFNGKFNTLQNLPKTDLKILCGSIYMISELLENKNAANTFKST